MSGRLSQHEKEKGTYFCSVTHKLDLAEEMIKTLPDFTYWAYIRHKPDTEDGTPHVHFLVRSNGTRSVKQIADKLGISPQYVQVCRKVYAFRRYMLHLDNDEKIKYTIDDVKSNRLETFREAIEGNIKRDVVDLYRDYNSLSMGLMAKEDFIQKWFCELSNMPFYQKIKTFELLDKVGRRDAHGLT